MIFCHQLSRWKNYFCNGLICQRDHMRIIYLEYFYLIVQLFQHHSLHHLLCCCFDELCFLVYLLQNENLERKYHKVQTISLFLSISAANYTGNSMKEISIINNSNSNYYPAKEADPCEEIDEQITNKNTSGKPFLNLNYK